MRRLMGTVQDLRSEGPGFESYMYRVRIFCYLHIPESCAKTCIEPKEAVMEPNESKHYNRCKVKQCKVSLPEDRCTKKSSSHIVISIFHC